MGRVLADLDEYFSPGLTLTVLGKEYVVPLASAELGLWCRRMSMLAGEVTAASTEAEVVAAAERARAQAEALPSLPGDLSFEERVLGATLAVMLADEVPDAYVRFCAETGYMWIIGGEDAAERYWTSGGRPQPAGPANRQERRAAAKRMGSGSRTTNTAAAATTRTAASTSGTKSRKPAAKKAAASRGSGS